MAEPQLPSISPDAQRAAATWQAQTRRPEALRPPQQHELPFITDPNVWPGLKTKPGEKVIHEVNIPGSPPEVQIYVVTELERGRATLKPVGTGVGTELPIDGPKGLRVENQPLRRANQFLGLYITANGMTGLSQE